MRRQRMWVGLIAFDMLRVRRSFEIVLARWQDRLVLLLMVLFAALAAATALDRPPGPAVAPAWAALAALLLGASVGAAHERRLEALVRRSIAAPLALAPAARAAHLAAVSALLLILALAAARLSALTGLFTWPALALVLLGWGAGMIAGAAGVARWSRRQPVPATIARGRALVAAPGSGSLLAITLRTQMPFRAPQTALLAAFALGAAQAVGAGICARALNPFSGGAVAVAAGLATLFAVARVPAAPCRFGAFVGVPTADALAAHLAGPASLTLGALLGALIAADPDLVLLELGCGLTAMLVVAFRVLHYRLDPKLRADRLMQAQLLLLAAAATGLPPLAPLLVIFRAVALYRASRRILWAVP